MEHLCPSSSNGQSAGLLIRGLQVRVLSGASRARARRGKRCNCRGAPPRFDVATGLLLVRRWQVPHRSCEGASAIGVELGAVGRQARAEFPVTARQAGRKSRLEPGVQLTVSTPLGRGSLYCHPVKGKTWQRRLFELRQARLPEPSRPLPLPSPQRRRLSSSLPRPLPGASVPPPRRSCSGLGVPRRGA